MFSLYGFGVIILLILEFCYAGRAYGTSKEEKAIIIKKNLFHSERKPWYMQEHKKSNAKKQRSKKQKKFINKVRLYGTIKDGDNYFAILYAPKQRRKRRSRKERAVAKNSLFMVGDYTHGFLIKNIEEDVVVLYDEAIKEEYAIYINDD